jgi:ketosteroid isomerase-like protein
MRDLSYRLRAMPMVLTILVACARARDRERMASADEAAIRSARAAQNAAIAAGDVDRAAGYWTEDVEIRRGLGQLIVGRDAYRQLVTPKGNRDSALVYQREPTAVVVSAKWPLAYESGTWAGHLSGVHGPVTISGQYSAQWVKRADRWLIRGEVFVALACGGVGCAYPAAP